MRFRSDNKLTMTLADESLKFSNELIGGWKEDGSRDTKSLRLLYLCSNAHRAADTSAAIWLLLQAGKIHDCHTLARTLFERMVRGRYAAESEDKFLGLIGGELNQELEKVQKWENSTTVDLGPMPYRDFRKPDIDFILAATGRTELPPKISIYEITTNLEGVAGESLYRALYRELCLYAHATFDVSRPNAGDKPEPPLIWLALFVPFDTAMQFYQIRGVALPNAAKRYDELKQRCFEASFRG
jgi:Family of unknown function (DUF5677)